MFSQVESATNIPITIDKVVYEQNKFLSANNDQIEYGLDLDKGDSCQGL